MTTEINLGNLLPTLANFLRGQQTAADSHVKTHESLHDSFEFCSFTDDQTPIPPVQLTITGLQRRQIEAAVLRLLANIPETNTTLTTQLGQIRTAFRQGLGRGQTANSPININAQHIPNFIETIQSVISTFENVDRPSARRITTDAKALLPLLQRINPQGIVERVEQFFELISEATESLINSARVFLSPPQIRLTEDLSLQNLPGSETVFVIIRPGRVFHNDIAVRTPNDRRYFRLSVSDRNIGFVWNHDEERWDQIDINDTAEHAQYRNARAAIEIFRAVRSGETTSLRLPPYVTIQNIPRLGNLLIYNRAENRSHSDTITILPDGRFFSLDATNRDKGWVWNPDPSRNDWDEVAINNNDNAAAYRMARSTIETLRRERGWEPGG